MSKITRLKENKKALAICLVIALIIIVMGIIFVPKAYKDYKHKTTTAKEKEKTHKNKQKKHRAAEQEANLPEALWTKNSGKEFTYKFTVSECDGEYTLIAPKDDGDIICTYQKDGKEYDACCFFDSIDLARNNYPDTITGIKTFDVDFDGYTDLIITGTVDSKEKFWFRLGCENDNKDDSSCDCTVFDRGLYLHSENKIYDVEDIENVLASNYDWFGEKNKNGEFKSYADAYKKVIDFYEFVKPGQWEYKLIYFNEDDIPELVVDRSGYYVSMFTFKNGYVCEPIASWPYGDIDNWGYTYKYKVKGNIIGNQSRYSCGNILVDILYEFIDGEIEELYQHTVYPNDDIEDARWYNKKLTEKQRKAFEKEADALDSVGWDSLSGEYSVTEIFQQLGIPEFKVEKLGDSPATFNFNDKEFNYEVENLKNNKKEFRLSDGTSTIKQTLKCDNYEAYLFSRDNDMAYLYLFVNPKDDSSLYIYNLNTKSIDKPIKYDGAYCICREDIENSNEFTLIANINDFGVNYSAKKEFFVDSNGMPIEKDKYGYFIKTNPKDDSSGNNEFGDALVLQKDFTCAATKDLSEKHIWCSEEYPEGDGKAEMVSFKEGAKFYLYKYRYEYYKDTIDLVHYYLVNDDGYMIEIQVDYDDGEVAPNQEIVFKPEK